MRIVPILLASLGALSLEQAVAQQNAEQLAQRYACTACHQPATRTVGPSWKEIAERYRDGSKTAEQLAQSLKKGSTGVWGPVPMPPQAQVGDADLTSLTTWILAQP